jgi:hypothetical protein
MVQNQFIFDWVKKATWSIREAAYLVNEYDPNDPVIEIDMQSGHPVSKAYVWLIKELNDGHLHPIAGEGDEARFSPGTLMRRLKEEDKAVSEGVFNLYQKESAHPGQQPGINSSRVIYRDAAKLVLEDYPFATGLQLAVALELLPSRLPHMELKPIAVATRRNYLKGIVKNGPGRPKKDEQVDVLIDWPKLVEKLTAII